MKYISVFMPDYIYKCGQIGSQGIWNKPVFMTRFLDNFFFIIISQFFFFYFSQNLLLADLLVSRMLFTRQINYHAGVTDNVLRFGFYLERIHSAKS